MKIMKNSDESVPDTEYAWSDSRGIRTSEKVEATDVPTGIGRENRRLTTRYQAEV